MEYIVLSCPNTFLCLDFSYSIKVRVTSYPPQPTAEGTNKNFAPGFQIAPFTALTIRSFFHYSNLMKCSNRGLNHHKCGIDQAPCSYYVFIESNEANKMWEKWSFRPSSVDPRYTDENTIMDSKRKLKIEMQNKSYSDATILNRIFLFTSWSQWCTTKFLNPIQFIAFPYNVNKEIIITWPLTFFFWHSENPGKKKIFSSIPSTASSSPQKNGLNTDSGKLPSWI